MNVAWQMRWQSAKGTKYPYYGCYHTPPPLAPSPHLIGGHGSSTMPCALSAAPSCRPAICSAGSNAMPCFASQACSVNGRFETSCLPSLTRMAMPMGPLGIGRPSPRAEACLTKSSMLKFFSCICKRHNNLRYMSMLIMLFSALLNVCLMHCQRLVWSISSFEPLTSSSGSHCS